MKLPTWHTTLFSRLLLIAGGLFAVWSVYWLVQVTLTPVPVPLAPPKRGPVRFDSTLDVSKNELFFRLQNLGPQIVPAPTLGRTNPFLPIEQPSAAVVSTSRSVVSVSTTTP